MSTQENYRLSEYQEMHDLLPEVFPETNPVSGSFFNSKLMALANEAGWLEYNLEQFRNNENVLTATEDGIGDWEDLVGLSRRTDLSLSSRRSRVYARLSGTPCTISTLKEIIRGYLGDDDFEIFEYWTTNNPASAFRYKVVITRPPTNDYDEESLQQDLVRVQPAHCGDFVEIEDVWDAIADTLTITEQVTAIKQNFFVIGTSPIGGTDVIAP